MPFFNCAGAKPNGPHEAVSPHELRCMPMEGMLSRMTSRCPIERPALSPAFRHHYWSIADGPVQFPKQYSERMSCMSTGAAWVTCISSCSGRLGNHWLFKRHLVTICVIGLRYQGRTVMMSRPLPSDRSRWFFDSQLCNGWPSSTCQAVCLSTWAGSVSSSPWQGPNIR